MSWRAPNGDDVYGVLELPPDYEKGKRYPLAVGIHGGPTTAVYASLEFDPYEGRTWLPAKGYALLLPNYRGSTGNGDKFLTDLVGRENDLDVEDILKGVDAMIERGIADPERLCVLGWSNGGYLTNCLITKTVRFKAASSGAGILDTVMEWGVNDEPAYPTVFKKGLPWKTPDTVSQDFADLRPRQGADADTDSRRRGRRTLPAGSQPHAVPGAEGIRESADGAGDLPGEPHGPMKYSNRKAKMEWDAPGSDKYVLGKE